MDLNDIKLDILPEVEGMSPFEQSIRALEADIHESGWDERPSFWVITKRPGGMLTSLFPLPDAFYSNPGVVLVKLTAWLSTRSGEKTLADMANAMKPLGELFAIGMVHEGWSLRQADGVTEEQFQQIIQENQGRIHLHPDRIETRTATFWTVDGAWGILHRERGTFPELEIWRPGEDEGRVFDGRIPNSLRTLMELING